MSSSALSAFPLSPTPRVLSVQSHTVHGFVGNKAATFPLQSMGFDVDCINTVSLSNHPAYHQQCRGESLSNDAYAQLIDGLQENSLLHYDVVLTGYTRSSAHIDTTVRAIRAIRAVNPHAVFVCDPVLGDNGEYYVPPELREEYTRKLLPLATAITPNMFECEVLSGVKIESLADAVKASVALHALGPRVVVMTGLDIARNMPTPHLAALLSVYDENDSERERDGEREGERPGHRVYRVDIPKIDRLFAGCGDLFAALTAAGLHALRVGHSGNAVQPIALLGEMLETSAQGMADVLALTRERASRELCVVEARDVYVRTERRLQRLVEREREREREKESAAVSVSPSVSPTLSFQTETERDSERDREAARETAAENERERNELYLSPPHGAFLAHHGSLSGVIFDMDGTLTEPGAIDFDAMYTRIGLQRDPRGERDILSLVEALPTVAERERALQIIYEEEMAGCARQALRPGLHALMHTLQREKVRLALCTRNCQDAYLHFMDKSSFEGSLFSQVLWRDALRGLNKPDPALARHIMDAWSVSRAETMWFVGDSADDMLCGKRAGCTTVLLATQHNGMLREDREVVDHVVHSLDELEKLLRSALAR